MEHLERRHGASGDETGHFDRPSVHSQGRATGGLGAELVHQGGSGKAGAASWAAGGRLLIKHGDSETTSQLSFGNDGSLRP